MDILLAQTTDAGLADLGKAIAFGVGVGLGAVGAGIGIGYIFGSMIQAVARQPELRGGAHRDPVARLRPHRGRRLLRAPRRAARLRPRLMGHALSQAFLFAQTTTTEESEGSLIDVVPGLMVWTIVTFVLVLWFLRRFAFSRVQGLIDERRDRIREALDEADKARAEARELRELTAKEREEAKAQREQILDESRRQAQRQLDLAREQADADLKERLEKNREELDAENARLREQIRRDVVELTLLASEKVTGKVLDEEDQRRLIDETIAEVDVKQIASEN